MSGNDDGVAALVALGATAEQASFFLSAANGDVEAAAAAFLDGGADAPSPAQEPTPPAGTSDEPRQAYSSAPYSGSSDSSSSSSSQRRPSGRPTGGFATLGSMGGGGGDDGDDSPGDKKDNEYYTGGAQSGQMVQDPNEKKQQGGGSGPGAAAFGGMAHKLGTATSGSTPVPGSGGAPLGAGGAGQQQQQAGGDGKPPSHDLHMWKNGFSLDDGPLRKFDDPANAEFVQALTRSEVPAELRRLHPGQEVHVAMHDKRGEEFVQPPKKLVPFSGQGNRLGSSDGAAPQQQQQEPQQRQQASAGAGGAGITVDESKPKTAVQIRFADGSAQRVEFNQDHTIGDIRAAIDGLGKGGFGYRLMTSFPPSPLEDHTQSIAAAGLLNSVVVQRRQ